MPNTEGHQEFFFSNALCPAPQVPLVLQLSFRVDQRLSALHVQDSCNSHTHNLPGQATLHVSRATT